MVFEIERAVGKYIAEHYHSAVEVGFGGKTASAQVLTASNIPVLCTDVHEYPDAAVPCVVDDCVTPNLSLYLGAEVIYSVRPGLEIVPALIALAKKAGADLIVYHLGFELYQDGGIVIDLGVCMLHQYV